jgi:hypothetical protein
MLQGLLYVRLNKEMFDFPGVKWFYVILCLVDAKIFSKLWLRSKKIFLKIEWYSICTYVEPAEFNKINRGLDRKLKLWTQHKT